jgi:hypothetical protein
MLRLPASLPASAHNPMLTTPLSGQAFAAELTTTALAAANEVSDADSLQAFSVLLGGSAVIVTAVLALIVGSEQFVKAFSSKQ